MGAPPAAASSAPPTTAISASSAPTGTWYGASDAWAAAPEAGACRPRVARQPKAVWPGWKFSDCGEGCRRATFASGETEVLAALQGTASRFRGEALYVSLSTRILAERTVFVLGTFAFGDGAPVALMASDDRCFAQVAGRNAPWTYKLFPLEGATEYRFASLDFARLESERALRWLSSPLSKTLGIFDFAHGFGGVEAHRDLWLSSEPGSAALARFHTSPGMVRSPQGDDELYWAEALNHGGAIMARTRDGRAESVATGAWFPVSLASANERLVWLGATGPRARDGQFDSTALYDCPRASSSVHCTPREVRALPLSAVSGPLSVAKHRAALTGCSGQRCAPYVVELDTKKAYRISPREADLSLSVIGISATELILAETSKKLQNTPDFDALRIYTLARIESYAEALP